MKKKRKTLYKKSKRVRNNKKTRKNKRYTRRKAKHYTKKIKRQRGGAGSEGLIDVTFNEVGPLGFIIEKIDKSSGGAYVSGLNENYKGDNSNIVNKKIINIGDINVENERITSIKKIIRDHWMRPLKISFSENDIVRSGVESPTEAEREEGATSSRPREEPRPMTSKKKSTHHQLPPRRPPPPPPPRRLPPPPPRRRSRPSPPPRRRSRPSPPPPSRGAVAEPLKVHPKPMPRPKDLVGFSPSTPSTNSRIALWEGRSGQQTDGPDKSLKYSEIYRHARASQKKPARPRRPESERSHRREPMPSASPRPPVADESSLPPSSEGRASPSPSTRPSQSRISRARETIEKRILEEWMRKRNQFIDTHPCHSDNRLPCVYIDGNTDINLIKHVLSTEAEPGSKVYLSMDLGHGSLNTKKSTKLNDKFNLLLFGSRGYNVTHILNEEYSARRTRYLKIMEKYLHDSDYNDLFDENGCMKRKGELLLYSTILCQQEIFLEDLFEDEELVINESTGETLNEDNFELKHLKLIPFINKTLERIKNVSANINKEIIAIENIMFSTLRLYQGDEGINDIYIDTVTPPVSARTEEMFKKEGIPLPTFKQKNRADYGVNILYTRRDRIPMFVHLPLNSIPRIDGSSILLSQVLEYLSPLNSLNFNYYLSYNMCRPDNDYLTGKSSVLTREISTKKEKEHKECFINSFNAINSREENVVENLEHISLDSILCLIFGDIC